MAHTTPALRCAALLATLAAALPAAAQNAPTALNTDRALQSGHEYLVVANRPNNLHVVDLQSNTLYKTCPLPDAFGPGTAQISPDRRTAYILNNRFEDIYGIDLDTCEVRFRAHMAQADNERAKAIFSFAISADGKSLYAVQNPTTLHRDHYRVGEPRFVVYDTAAGLDAKPVRSFPAPRQATVMQAALDGSGAVYMAGANLYRVDPATGTFTTTLPIRDWQRPGYAPPDVLYAWPIQTPTKDFTLLYTTARVADASKPESAEYRYGLLNVNLQTGEAEAPEFGPLTEIYFSGVRWPKDRNIMFGLLHRLAKYDIKAQKLLEAVELEHTYYALLTNASGSRLYLTGTFNDIAVYDAETLKKVTNVQLPGGDMSLGTGQVFMR
ncbi:quinohemoprotein amine dehydrogenase subunit beta [Azoarcus olearius]|uniref:Probable quinohemoprotein amine dehydrogease,beta subunit n=1 Tax=Azoarcus sp. (strain BH72) TaxID=418699 RepID=A1K4V4_AZOSB|nr:quinohemoprotein amine dehydrogenase subunit beta [Azoarcus olearius]CAL93859.1 probable quinohemoprotein amine dehydrogease,beta subunit [Azoarcus olearius]